MGTISRVHYTNSSIVIDHNQLRICLDPRKEMECDYIFVSHAHLDHLYRARTNRTKAKVIASNATSKIATTRGYEFRNLCNDHGFELLDTGHILGSSGLLIEDQLYYTGDISIRKRAFMNPALIPKAKVLIIESTFGREEYVFPKFETVMHQANLLISEMYHQGRPIVLMGYPLGKAQILTDLFHHWDPLFVEDSILVMNRLYSELGVSISVHKKFSLAEKEGLLSSNKPWILIAPLNSYKSGFLDHIKKKYAPITIGFSGWAIKPNYKYYLGIDHCFPISDHCDYNDLVRVVEKCNPEKVYTFHGFDTEFANSLRSLGFDADPIRRKIGEENTRTNPTLLTDWC